MSHESGLYKQVVLVHKWSLYTGGPCTQVVLTDRWSSYTGVPCIQLFSKEMEVRTGNRLSILFVIIYIAIIIIAFYCIVRYSNSRAESLYSIILKGVEFLSPAGTPADSVRMPVGCMQYECHPMFNHYRMSCLFRGVSIS